MMYSQRSKEGLEDKTKWLCLLNGKAAARHVNGVPYPDLPEKRYVGANGL